MSLFLDYLKKTHTSLDSDSNEDAGPEEYVKAGICEILVLYAQKYEDAFGELIPSFVDATWNLLTTIGPEPKYDIVSIESTSLDSRRFYAHTVVISSL